MSEQYKSLDKIHAERYLEKIECIGNEDPYCMSDFSNKIADLPPVLYPDIVNYLVFTRSAFSMEQLKAYKGLESYKAASSGWVRELRSKRIGEHIVVLGKVKLMQLFIYEYRYS